MSVFGIICIIKGDFVMKIQNDCVKRIFLMVFVGLVCVCMAACASGSYNKAEELYGQGDYAAALALYEELGDHKDAQQKANLCRYHIADALFAQQKYEEALPFYQKLEGHRDSDDKAAVCRQQIGMAANADNDFLAALEQSVADRLSATAQGTETLNLKIVVDTELAYLEGFADAAFYDQRLSQLAKQYLDGLYEQEEALGEDLRSDHDFSWLQGEVDRLEVLCCLYEEYGFMAEDVTFVANCVKQAEEVKTRLAAHKAIEDDIDEQTSSDAFEPEYEYLYDNRGRFSFRLKNNTEYTYSTVFDFRFLTEDNNLFYSDSITIENIRPGESYTVSVDIDLTDCYTEGMSWEWENYYSMIKW